MKKMIKYILIFGFIIGFIILFINFFIVLKESKRIISEDEAAKKENIDCILILGAGIRDEKPTHMLEDRLLQGISLYEKNASENIMMK